VPVAESVAAFVEAFATLGYHEISVEVHGLPSAADILVVYTDVAGVPTHMARRLASGRWTSKMGQDVDIEHDDLECLAGPRYGRPAVILARQIVADSP